MHTPVQIARATTTKRKQTQKQKHKGITTCATIETAKRIRRPTPCKSGQADAAIEPCRRMALATQFNQYKRELVVYSAYRAQVESKEPIQKRPVKGETRVDDRERIGKEICIYSHDGMAGVSRERSKSSLSLPVHQFPTYDLLFWLGPVYALNSLPGMRAKFRGLRFGYSWPCCGFGPVVCSYCGLWGGCCENAGGCGDCPYA